MITKWKSAAMVLGMALALGTPAFAHGNCRPGGSSGAAPEVDPSLGIAGITFLAGSITVMRSRLRK